MELAQAQYERRAPTLASQRDSVTHDLRHTVPSHVLETQPAAPVCVTPRTPGRIAESNGPAFRGPARGPSDGLENSNELMVSEMCAGVRPQHWGNLAVFRQFLRFSGIQDAPDEVDADPHRLSPSTPGLPGPGQRQHRPHHSRVSWKNEHIRSSRRLGPERFFTRSRRISGSLAPYRFRPRSVMLFQTSLLS